MKTLNTLCLFIISLLLCSNVFGYSKSVTPTDLGCKEAVAGEKLELGQWYTNFSVCKSYADENGIPLVAVWSNHGCIHCYYLDVCFLQDEFKTWQSSADSAQVIWCFMAGGEDGYPDQAGSDAYNWVFFNGGAKISMYPGVVLWWKDTGVNVRTTGDALRGNLSLTDAYIGQSTQNVIAAIDSAFADWVPEKGPALDDVSFKSKSATVSESAGTYSIEVVRTVGTNKSVNAALDIGTNACSKVKIVDSEVSWDEWETGSKTFNIEIADDDEPADDVSIEFTLKTDADSSKTSTFTLKIVDDDAKQPTFLEEDARCEAVQYVAFSKSVQMKSYGTGMALYKKSGSLPSGVKATYDSTAKAAVFSGTSTKAGTYNAVFQASEMIDGKRTYGNTMNLTIVVQDISAVNTNMAKTITLQNGLVMDGDRLIGLMNLTIPKTGKISAKFTSSSGTISLASTGWSSVLDGTLTSVTATKSGMSVIASIDPDGAIEAYVQTEESQYAVTFAYLKKWTKDEFSEYAGLYNVSIRQTSSSNPSANDGYAQIKLAASSYSSGRVQVSGMLPDGKIFSVASTLQFASYAYYGIAVVPVFYRSSSDVFSALVLIDGNGIIGVDRSVVGWWQRIDKYVESANAVEDLSLDGMKFDKTADMSELAYIAAGTTNLQLTVDASAIAQHGKYGNAQEMVLPDLCIAKSGISIDKSMLNPCKLSISYSKTTGLITGRIYIPFENGYVYGTIKGPLFNLSTIPVIYSGYIDKRTLKCGFNIIVSLPSSDDEDCGCSL